MVGLKQEKIEEIEHDIKQLKSDISSYNAKELHAKEEIAAKSGKLDSMKSAILVIEQELAEHRNVALAMAQHIHSDKAEIASLEKQLEEDAFTKNLQALIDEQPDFFDVLKTRYEKKMEEISDGMEIFGGTLNSEKFCKEIKQMIDSMGFSRSHAEMRNCKAQYNDYLKEVCTMKLQNKKISAAKKLERFDYLDRLIFMQEVERIWNIDETEFKATA